MSVRNERLPDSLTVCYASGMIIGIANAKGGVGKSTTAVHLAAWLHDHGYRVALVDCDAQASSSEWCKEALPSVHTVCLRDNSDILRELPLLDADHDFVIADGPGGDNEASRALLLRANLAILPCKASMLEARALSAATLVLDEARSIRSGLPHAVIVLSMVGKNYRLTQDMKNAAAALSLPVAETPLILRQVYADAPGQGTVVWKMGTRSQEAAAEIDRLFRELLPQVAAKSDTKKPMARKA